MSRFFAPLSRGEGSALFATGGFGFENPTPRSPRLREGHDPLVRGLMQ